MDEHQPIAPAASGSPLNGYSAYWSCLLVFAALLIANGFHYANNYQQRQSLRQGKENAEALLAQAQLIRSQLEPRLQSFSLDLLRLASTNDTARQIVSQFNISWTPERPGTPLGAPTNSPSD